MVSIKTLIFALSLTVATMAAPVKAPKPRTAESISATAVYGKLKCPAGWERFNTTTEATFDGVTLERAWQHVGDFCDVKWQGFDFFGVKGECNSALAIRKYGIGALEFTDRLDHVFHTPEPHASGSSLVGRKFSSYLSSASPADNVVPATVMPEGGVAGLRPGHPMGSTAHHHHTSHAGPTRYHALAYSLGKEVEVAGAWLKGMRTLLKVEETLAGSKVTWDTVGCTHSGDLILEDLLGELHEGALFNAGNSFREQLRMRGDRVSREPPRNTREP